MEDKNFDSQFILLKNTQISEFYLPYTTQYIANTRAIQFTN